MENLKSFLKQMVGWLIVVVIFYLFLSVCNWNLSLAEWNGFSRFIFATIGFFGLLIAAGDAF